MPVRPSGRIDHAMIAREQVVQASKDVSENWPMQTGEYKADLIALAQVHATLALVEQQTIANRLQLALVDQLTMLAEDRSEQPPALVAIRIRDYLSASDWVLIEVPEDDLGARQ